MSRLSFFLILICLLLVADDIESRRHRRYRSRSRRRHHNDQFAFGRRPRLPRWKFSLLSRFADFNFAFNHGGGSRDWWDGPNVCTHKEEKNETTREDITGHTTSVSRTCDDKETSYICTETVTINGKKTTVREIKECCHGYSRHSGQIGCPTYRELDDIVNTSRALNLTDFLRAAESIGLQSKLQNSGANFTVFAPTNKAFSVTPNLIPPDEYSILSDMNSVIRISPPISTLIVGDASDLVLGHVTGGILTTTRLKDEQIITSAGSKSSTIRVNFYDMVDDGVMTANCKRVSSRDNLATNGVIHVVEEVLPPVTKSLLDIISSNPQLSYLKTAIGSTGIGQDLRNDGQFTLFAPSDNAFQKLDNSLLQRILSDQRCLKKVLFHHLLPNVICSSAVSDKHRSRTKNQLSNYLHLSRDQDNKLFVEKSQIIDRDVMATNGVLHLIDDVIIPDEALGVIDAIQKMNITRLPELIIQTGLKKSLEQAENISVLVPTDEAFNKMSTFAVNRLNDSQTSLADTLRYHVIPTVSTCHAYDGYQFPTWNPKRNLTVHTAISFPYHGSINEYIQCSTIVKYNIPSCNAVIHLIDKVLIPPVGTVMDILAVDSRFTEFVRLMKISGMADQLQRKGPYTVLAPTNKALKAVPKTEMKELTSSKEKLEDFIKDHVIRGHKCCSEIQRYAYRHSIFSRNLRSLLWTRISVETSRGQLTLSSSPVIECDMVGTNGVVHGISAVLQDEMDSFSNFRMVYRFG